MAGMTNRGKYWTLDWVFRGASLPTNYYVALATSAVAPTADINTFGELTQIATGNGYTDGGYSLTPNGTSIPDTGDGARYAVLLDDNVTIGSRIVIGWWDLTTDRSVSNGQTLTLQDLELRLQEPA
jgi:hypothetical protein